MEIYFPMTAQVITPGHIKCLEFLAERGFVTVGLLTSNALRGYKKEVVPYSDRKYVLDTLALIIEDIRVVPQESLNPSKNVKYYGCNALASGDGFEKVELAAIEKLGLKKIDIKLKGESGKKRYSSSDIIEKGKEVV